MRPISTTHCQPPLSYERGVRAYFCAAFLLILLVGPTFPSSAQSTTAGIKINGPVPWIDVTTYGATGNGSTDDTTDIQLAINACPTSPSGCTVFFPQGTYKTTSALTIPYTVPGVKLVGQCAVTGVGSSCSQITGGTNAVYMVVVGQTSLANAYFGFEVRNLQFTDLSGTGKLLGALQLNAVNNFRVESIYCNNFKGTLTSTTGSCIEFVGSSGTNALVTQYGTIVNIATTNTKFPLQTTGKTSSINVYGGDVECNLTSTGQGSIGMDIGFTNSNSADNNGGEWGVFGTHILNCDTAISLNSSAAFQDYAILEQTNPTGCVSNCYHGLGTGVAISVASGQDHTAGTVIAGSMSEFKYGVVLNSSVDPVTITASFNVVTNPFYGNGNAAAEAKALALVANPSISIGAQIPTDLTFVSESAPSVSLSSDAKEYFDSSAFVFKESRNGGAFGFRGFAPSTGLAANHVVAGTNGTGDLTDTGIATTDIATPNSTTGQGGIMFNGLPLSQPATSTTVTPANNTGYYFQIELTAPQVIGHFTIDVTTAGSSENWYTCLYNVSGSSLLWSATATVNATGAATGSATQYTANPGVYTLVWGQTGTTAAVVQGTSGSGPYAAIVNAHGTRAGTIGNSITSGCPSMTGTLGTGTNPIYPLGLLEP